ncbi:MAG: hypothetical protein WCE30_14190 [Mycobacterium sp.]
MFGLYCESQATNGIFDALRRQLAAKDRELTKLRGPLRQQDNTIAILCGKLEQTNLWQVIRGEPDSRPHLRAGLVIFMSQGSILVASERRLLLQTLMISVLRGN